MSIRNWGAAALLKAVSWDLRLASLLTHLCGVLFASCMEAVHVKNTTGFAVCTAIISDKKVVFPLFVGLFLFRPSERHG